MRHSTDEPRPRDDVDEIIRVVLVSIEDDPSSLAKRFQAMRFVTRGNLIAGAETVFTTNWAFGSA